MPIYKYSCDKCKLVVELNRKISDRDDLIGISIDYCPIAQKESKKQFEKYKETSEKPIAKYIPHDCELKRDVTPFSFTI